jgi:hypothetical protein
MGTESFMVSTAQLQEGLLWLVRTRMGFGESASENSMCIAN